MLEALRHALRFGAAAGAGYLLGTTPSARLAAQLLTAGAVDLASAGSGNPGAANAARVLGRGPGAVVAAADVGKGLTACAAGRAVAGDPGSHLAGVAAVLGHCYPMWSRFRGGKGVATSFGQCLYTFPAYAPIDAAFAVTIAYIPGIRRPIFVSAGAASLAWIAGGFVWWRRRLPNLWGPRPTALLPLANAATVAVLASRARSREHDDEYRRPAL